MLNEGDNWGIERMRLEVEVVERGSSVQIIIII
jgi:hypothetical protein